MDAHFPVLCFTWETGGIIFATTWLSETDDEALSLLPMVPPLCTPELVRLSVPTKRGAWVHYGWHKHHKEYGYGEDV